MFTSFDAGRRHPVNHRASAAYDAYAASLRQSVLTALRQLEDNPAALKLREQGAGVQATAAESAQRSLDLSNTRDQGGVTSYLEVITAQNAALSDEVTAVSIVGRWMASAVSLIEAVSGDGSDRLCPNVLTVAENWQ